MEIQTARLFLREFRDGDEQALIKYNGLPEARFYLRKGEGTEKHIRSWVEGAIEETKRHPRVFFSWAIVHKEQDKLIGKAVLAKVATHSTTASLGWELDRNFWSRGYMTEAMRAVKTFALEDLGLSSVHAECFQANTASVRLMEKLGMKRERGWAAHPRVLAWHYNEDRPIVRYSATQ